MMALAACLTGCGAHHHSTSTIGRAAKPSPRPRLTGAHPCPGQPGFTCSTLRVPLDHAGQAGGTLALAVGVANAKLRPAGRSCFSPEVPGNPGSRS